MRSTKSRSLGLLVALSLLGAAPAATVEAADGPQAVSSKTCKRGTHAVLSWGHKCLSAGQFCKKGKNRQYHRYGFHCKRNGHLKNW